MRLYDSTGAVRTIAANAVALASEWQSELAHRKELVKAMQTKTNDLKTKLGRAQLQTQVLTAIVDARKADLDAWIRDITKHITRVNTEWTKRKKDGRRPIVSLENAKYTEVIGVLQNTLKQARDQRQKLEEDITASVVETTTLQTEMKKHQEEQTRLQLRINELTDLLTQTKDQYEIERSETEKQITELQNTIGQLQEQLTAAPGPDAIERLNTEKAALEQAKADADARVQELQAELGKCKGPPLKVKGAEQKHVDTLAKLAAQEQLLQNAQASIRKLSTSAPEGVRITLDPLIASGIGRNQISTSLQKIHDSIQNPSPEVLQRAQALLRNELRDLDSTSLERLLTQVLTALKTKTQEEIYEDDELQKLRLAKRAAMHELLSQQLDVQIKRVDALLLELNLLNASEETKQPLVTLHAELTAQLQQHMRETPDVQKDEQAAKLLSKQMRTEHIRALTTERAMLQKQLADATEAREELAASLKATEAKLVEAERNAEQVTTLSAQLNEAQRQLQTCLETQAKQERELNETRASAKQFQTEATNCSAELESTRNVYTTIVHNLEAQASALEQANVKKAEQLRQKEEQVGQLTTRLQSQQTAIDALNAQLAEQSTNFKTYESQYTALNLQLQAANERETTLKEQLQQNSSQVTAVTAKARVYVESAQAQAQAANAERVAIQSQLNETTVELQRITEGKNSMENELRQKINELEAIRRELAETKTQLTKTKTELETIRAESEKLREASVDAQQQHDARIKELTEALRSCEEQETVMKLTCDNEKARLQEQLDATEAAASAAVAAAEARNKAVEEEAENKVREAKAEAERSVRSARRATALASKQKEAEVAAANEAVAVAQAQLHQARAEIEAYRESTEENNKQVNDAANERVAAAEARLAEMIARQAAAESAAERVRVDAEATIAATQAEAKAARDETAAVQADAQARIAEAQVAANERVIAAQTEVASADARTVEANTRLAEMDEKYRMAHVWLQEMTNKEVLLKKALKKACDQKLKTMQDNMLLLIKQAEQSAGPREQALSIKKRRTEAQAEQEVEMSGGARDTILKKYIQLADAFHAVNKTKWQGQTLYTQGLRGGMNTHTYEKHMSGLKQQHDQAEMRFDQARTDFTVMLQSLLPRA